MGSLIPDSEKQKIANVFNDIHDTFARDIVIYKRENEIFVSTSSTYNALYSRIKNDPTTRSKVTKATVKARIAYASDQKEIDLPGTRSQINVQMDEGSVRVKIDQNGYELFTQAAKIEIDGEIFRIVSDPAKVGPFAVQFYTLFLRRAN